MRSTQLDQVREELDRYMAELAEAYDAAPGEPTRHERLVLIATLNRALKVQPETHECHAGVLSLPYDAVLACLGNGWLLPQNGNGYAVTRTGIAALHNTSIREVAVAA